MALFSNFSFGRKPAGRVLIANNVAAFKNSALVDNLIANTLADRGWDVSVVRCDGVLNACQNLKFRFFNDASLAGGADWKQNPLTCSRCEKRYREIFTPNLKCFRFSDYVDHGLVKEITSSINDTQVTNDNLLNINIHEHAFAATARFFAKGRPGDEVNFKEIYQKFLIATVQTILAYNRIIKSCKPDVIVAHHGIYVPQGPVIDVAKHHGVRVITWNPGYRKGTFLFVEGDTYHKVMPDLKLRQKPLSSDERNLIADYLSSRRSANDDWIWFNKAPTNNETFYCRYGVDNQKKSIALFANVFWDAQLHFKDSIFKDMLDWIEKTIDWVSGQKDIHLFIRAHPAEETGATPSRQAIHEMIASKSRIPDNVTIIKSSDRENSYDLANEADLSVVYGSKMAGEIAAMGKRVVVAGEAWARGKGFTIDARSQQEYFDLLKKWSTCTEKQSSEITELALRYCYQLFFEAYKKIEMAIPSEIKGELFTIANFKRGEMKAKKDQGFEEIMSIITGDKMNDKK